jgi:hypothetical protein
MAPTEECDIVIDLACMPTDANVNATTCKQLPPLVTIWEQHATWMQFKYYEGDCEQSANMQTEKFFCEDFAPIPQDLEAEIYLMATAKDDLSTIFFAGNHKLNDLYNMMDPSGNRLPADMNLTVYELQGVTLLQHVQYHSSCSQNLFLKDRYGVSQLVAFFNELQGLVDCFITSNYTFTIANNGTLPATLDSLVTLTKPFGPFDLTNEVLSQMLQPGDNFVMYLPIVIDLTVRPRYTLLATITGTFTRSAPCSSSDFLDFIAGNTLPPSILTLALTTSPTRSPAPTFNVVGAACELEASIECTIVNGGRGSCGNFVIPSTTCSDGSLSSLTFKMVTGDCASSTATPDKTCCDDFAPMTGHSFQVEAGSFAGTVAKDNTFTVNNPDNCLSVTITGRGTLMQEQELETQCEADEDLTLGKTFGGLQLVGFMDGSGPNTPIIKIVNQYIVFNPQVTAQITLALEAYTLNGENGGSSLIAADGEIIASKAQVVYEGETVPVHHYFQYGSSERGRRWPNVWSICANL